jgi:pimeloyl-ACP methyl ester carboxylesterase
VSEETKTLVLLHDEDRSAKQWEQLLPVFSPRFHVIAPDLPQGDLRARAAFVRSLLEANGGGFGVVGHGTGGALAQVLALGDDVDAMVLLDSPRADDPDLTDDVLAAWEFPVLMLWGEDDEIVPIAAAEALHEAIPASTLGLVPGCGHDLLEEAAPTIAPMIYEYLRARYLRAPHGHSDASGIVMLQLERRPPWVDLAEDEEDPWFDVDEREDET